MAEMEAVGAPARLSPDAPLARYLAAQRPRLNAKFAEARRRWPRLDGEIFSRHLTEVVAGCVETVDTAQPAAAAAVAETLYDLSLELVGQDFIGPGTRYPFINAGWRTLLPRLPRQLAAAPRPVAGSVTNALYQLSLERGARPQVWLDLMLELAQIAPEPEVLLRAGQVAAWRAGLAHYRQSALAVCRTLPPAVGGAVLGLSAAAAAQLPRVLDRLADNPWLTPAAALEDKPRSTQPKLVARVGAFRGFGGEFMEPPTLAMSAGRLAACVGDTRWLVWADIFGATLKRIEPAEPLTEYRRGAQPAVEKWLQAFPDIQPVTSLAADMHTLAVTTSLSHAVYLLAAV